MDNQEKFKQSFTELAEVFDKPFSGALTKAYWNSLKEFTDEEVNNSINRAILTLKFFPKPVELREFITGNPNDRAIEAWSKIIKIWQGGDSPKMVNGELIHPTMALSSEVREIINSMGGMYYLKQCSMKDLDFKGREFKKLFESQVNQGAIDYKSDPVLIGSETKRLSHE